MSEQEIRVLVKHKPATLTLTSNGTIHGLFSPRKVFLDEVPVYLVLWAETEGNTLKFSYLKRNKRGKGKTTLTSYAWTIEEVDKEAAERWCKAVMEVAYAGTEPSRRLRILVNPHGGPGKAKQIYEKTVEPIFRAAKSTFETTYTEYSKHAQEIAKNLPLNFDALVLLSGDGLLHEIYNGFAEHDDPMRAFAIPVAPVPTGSANGMAINLLGVEDGFDVGIACLNAIKGKPMKQDICSVTIGNQRIFSYFSVTLGLMADLDLGTEHLRWMGDLRFVVGYLQGVITKKTCPIKLELKVAESNKDRLVEEFRERGEAHRRAQLAQELIDHKHNVGDDSLPVLRHIENSQEDGDDSWVTFDKPLTYFYAGSSPYVARDLMQFPVAHASDGLIDVVAQERTTRGEMLSAMDGAHKGAAFWRDSQHYFKVHAYRITPLAPGNLAIDGERYDLAPFQVECHRALGALLSPTGYYAAEFDLPKPTPEDVKSRAGKNRSGRAEGTSVAGAEGSENVVQNEDESGEHGPKKRKRLFGCI